MFNEDILMLNNKAYSNNNDILLEIINKLQNIVNDLNCNKEINNIISQIKNIIIIMNNVINNNKKNTEEIRKDINNLHKDMINQFKMENILVKQKMVKEKEKEYITIIMVIEKWETISMIRKLESM